MIVELGESQRLVRYLFDAFICFSYEAGDALSKMKSALGCPYHLLQVLLRQTDLVSTMGSDLWKPGPRFTKLYYPCLLAEFFIGKVSVKD